MNTYMFRRDTNNHWINPFTWLCAEGIREWVAVPSTAKKLYVTVSGRASKQAYKYKLRDWECASPDILLRCKDGEYEDSCACELEYRAKNDNWPKTGYIKVEYSE